MTSSPNLATLVAGLFITVLGVLLVLDADGSINLGFAYMAPVVVGALGAILLAGGVASRDRD
jgi:drug/metabolite transporter (DMT)-like permease